MVKKYQIDPKSASQVIAGALIYGVPKKVGDVMIIESVNLTYLPSGEPQNKKGEIVYQVRIEAEMVAKKDSTLDIQYKLAIHQTKPKKKKFETETLDKKLVDGARKKQESVLPYAIASQFLFFSKHAKEVASKIDEIEIGKSSKKAPVTAQTVRRKLSL